MNFCTLFDSNYVSKGIALYLSIIRQTNQFVLYVMAMDRKCQEILNICGLSNIVVECIDDINSEELSKAKSDRSRAEFCWTCGSFITDHFLHQYQLADIVYLDSDLMFFESPAVISEELKQKQASVGLTPHFTSNILFGKYCVQYVYFKNDSDGLSCLRWWRDECLKWCYSKLEDGKYGDQKYLEYFANQFSHVHDIENRGVGIAYWNMYNYNYSDGHVSYGGQSWPVVFFHYSGINVFVNDGILYIRHSMYLNDTIRKLFIEPYAELQKYTFTNYLNTPISKIVISPLEADKYQIKRMMYYLGKVFPVQWVETLFMKLKYRQRKSPYSERKQ